MVQVLRFLFSFSGATDAKHHYFQQSEGAKKKKESSKAEWKLQPRETYSTSVFVHGCKHLDLVYDLGREAATM